MKIFNLVLQYSPQKPKSKKKGNIMHENNSFDLDFVGVVQKDL